jgi:serine protease AprX
MKIFVRRLLFVFVILSILLPGIAAPASAADWQTKVDPWVLQTATEGETEFLVYLTAQADLSGAKALPTKLEKGTYVYESLTAIAGRTQNGLIAQLDQLGVEYRPYWITNMIWVRGGLNTVQQLAGRVDIAHVYANPHVALDAPIEDISSVSLPEAIEWNIRKVNAPQVWALGYTGQGAVIGGQDTGYQWDHPALKNQYRGWNGAPADHNYNWHDAIHDSTGNPCGNDSPFPCDDYGHGTHTMGTMVGDDGGANQIGMAPRARWIGCRNMDQGVGTPATYAECYQWFIAPTDLNGENARPDLAPDVINNSWGCPPSEGCTNPNVLLTVVQNLVAAGIVSAHSAGNSGSVCSSVSEPAAIYDESFTVGATSSTDSIAGFSSRGPVTIDGSNRPKPDISAPGVNIRSSVPGGGYEGGWQGTSMAGPHVAGLVALLISAQPALRGQVSQIEYTIEQSALHIPWTGCSSSGVPNNAYGWGRIDALAAVESTHQLELGKVASTDLVSPGDLITYTLTVTHTNGVGLTTNVVLTDTIPVGSTLISATSPYSQSGDTIRWDFPVLEEIGTITTDLVVRTNFTATGTITNSDYVVHSDQVALVWGEPVTTLIEEPTFLELNKVASAPMIFPGDLLTYTLTITNVQVSIPATNIVLTDTIPLGSTFVSASLPYTQTGQVIQWGFPSLDPMGKVTADLVVRTNITSTGAITNSDYVVHSDQVALVWGEPVTTLIKEPTFLELNKVASAPMIFPGDLLTYTLTITNVQVSIPAINIVLTDTIPLGSTFVSASLPYTQTGQEIQWGFPSLEALGTRSVELVVKADLNAFGAIMNSDYAVRSDQMAVVYGEPVITKLEKLDILQLDTVADTSIAFPGDVQVYTFTVRNNHDLITATNLVLTDTLPLGSSFFYTTEPYSMIGDVIRWDIPSLPAGQTIYISLGVRIDKSASGSLTNAGYGVYADQAAFVPGVPVNTPLGKVFFLPIAIKMP